MKAGPINVRCHKLVPNHKYKMTYTDNLGEELSSLTNPFKNQWPKVAAICISVILLIGVCAIAISIVRVTPEDLPTDSSLIANFKKHEAQFEQLPAMAKQDSRVRLVQDFMVGLHQGGPTAPYIYVHRDKSWPAEAQLIFSQERWSEYLSIFEMLGLEGGMDRKSEFPHAVFFTASLNVSELEDYQWAIVRKGYAYVPGGIESDLRDSLDNIHLNRPAVVYRKLQDRWYLFYRWSVSKPE